MNGRFTLLFIFLFTYFSSIAQFNKILDFDSINGKQPCRSLIANDRILYGMTPIGGIKDQGVLFKMNLDGSGYKKIIDFTGNNGKNATGGLFSDGLALFGVTSEGGVNDSGVLFKVNYDGTNFTKLIDFGGQLKGSYPSGSVVSDGVYLYGVTSRSGNYKYGIIYKIKPDGSNFIKIFDFIGSSTGVVPTGSLLLDSNYLYGTTSGCNTNCQGTVFKIKTDGSDFTVLHSFTGLDGIRPSGSLIYDGKFLYGTTMEGGTHNNGDGTIFRIRPSGSDFSTLLDFTDSINGMLPYASLTFVNNSLYGMTHYGVDYNKGIYNTGTIFKIDTNGTGYTKIKEFDGMQSGSNPLASLLYFDKSLYGMSSSGGLYDKGTVFKFILNTGVKENNDINNTIELYPNPNRGIFSLKYKFGSSSDFEIEIYNYLGQKVIKNPIQDNYQIDISGSQPGVYLAKITNKRGDSYIKFVIE